MDTLRPLPTLPATPREFGFYIDGDWRGGRAFFDRASPGHGVAVTRIPKCSIEDLNDAVAAARRAFEDRRWAGLSGAARAGVLLRAAEILRRRRAEIAYWEVLENGKPISQAMGEIDHCIACFEVGAGAARLLHGDSYNSLGDGLFGMVLREPIGVVGLITPWGVYLLFFFLRAAPCSRACPRRGAGGGCGGGSRTWRGGGGSPGGGRAHNPPGSKGGPAPPPKRKKRGNSHG